MTVYVLNIDKTTKHDGIIYNGVGHYVGESAISLEQFIKEKYNVELKKDEQDDFPYFTDGGFLYRASNEYWAYKFTCYPQELIKEK